MAKLTSILTSPSSRMPKPSLVSAYKTNAYVSDFAGYSDGEDNVNRSPSRRPKSVTFDKEPPEVLQYEMVTPDPSVDGSSPMHYDSDEDEDDYEDELENTPVIEPDEWARMTPEAIMNSHLDDPFRSTPSPTARPLPPIPGAFISREESNSPSSGRPLPSLPVTKADLQNIQKMPLEERMRLMLAYEEHEGVDENPRRSSVETGEIHEERDELGEMLESMGINEKENTGPLDGRDESMSPVQLIEDAASDSEGPSPNTNRDAGHESGSSSQYESASEYEPPPPRLSRESIRRQVEARRKNSFEPGLTPPHDLHDEQAELNDYDQEAISQVDDGAQIKREVSDDEGIDMYKVPEMDKVPERPASRFATRSPDHDTTTDSEASHCENDNDDESRYSEYEENELDIPSREESTPTPPNPQLFFSPHPIAKEPGFEEPRKHNQGEARMSLPDLSSMLDRDGLGLSQYMTPPPPPPPETSETPEQELAPSSSIARDLLAERAESPAEEEDDNTYEDEDTGSVIRHKIYHSDEDEEEADDEDDLAESIATIRAPGGKLKTRASATPADMAQMAAARRQVSGDMSGGCPPVPRIPDGYRSGGDSLSGSEDEGDDAGVLSHGEEVERKASGRKKSIGLPALGEFEFDLKLDDLSEEFDRVIEAQKRGYLMRQNTRVIHASSRDPEDDVAGPSRPGHSRTQSWSVEPWRASTRRRSTRDSLGGSVRKRPSNVGAMPSGGKDGKLLPMVNENDVEGRASLNLQPDDGTERGRLFVKVIGVKDLGLPLPQGQPTYFCLTLDNGLHCVTTSWLELAKNAPIGQEFELVVLNDLEFQHFPPSQSNPRSAGSLPLLRSGSSLTRATCASDGMGLDFESKAFGRPFTTDINCFNEWAVDTASVKSKKGLHGSLQPARKAPYKIGKLEVQLMFVPKPKGATDKELPKSMNAAIRELREAESTLAKTWEGNLSQQGGDCPFWRRRYFKLVGPRLTAYHEATRQPRATINLSKASKIIYDRKVLVDPEVKGPGKSRRKSGFSEDEEGYMFVEEGFRIRFGNGEVIDFYADSAADKQGWIKILDETIGRIPEKRGWCDTVLSKEARERAERERAQATSAKVKAAQQQMRQNAQMNQNQSQNQHGAQQPPRSTRRPPPANTHR
ncbi:unnamed protein product [Tuber melanosporum]|uniref:(Perigord truffle) hypothetical protein n=1 Tax=Tuber melanosporum (strain Mel28) TaxID=656061 RepID=D5GBF9_TUBMM|nr:uncharacterized protein GSTUM_00000456001 [Tuber melanosporum]CAZ81852.1 unnamed protein product [Tuber melanosporum]